MCDQVVKINFDIMKVAKFKLPKLSKEDQKVVDEVVQELDEFLKQQKKDPLYDFLYKNRYFDDDGCLVVSEQNYLDFIEGCKNKREVVPYNNFEEFVEAIGDVLEQDYGAECSLEYLELSAKNIDAMCRTLLQ